MSKKTKQEPVEYFTDKMHQEMFLFQAPLSSRYASTGKPAMKALSTRPRNGTRIGKIAVR